MDRSIKFRVWGGSKMHFQDPYMQGSNGFVEFVTIYTGYEDSDEWSNYVLMQYTGLKDKNGQEIYEGDIVLLENEVPRGDGQYDDEIGEVVWDNSEACFLFKSNLENEYLGYAHPDRVIGNKFENPELLED